MATKKSTGIKKSTGTKKTTGAKKQRSGKPKYVCGIGDDGWGIHDVQDAPKSSTTQKKTGKK